MFKLMSYITKKNKWGLKLNIKELDKYKWVFFISMKDVFPDISLEATKYIYSELKDGAMTPAYVYAGKANLLQLHKLKRRLKQFNPRITTLIEIGDIDENIETTNG